MYSDFNPIRYSIIYDKNPREIIMLRGSGCKWRRCSFCDYHFDFSLDEKANFELNRCELEKVTGSFQCLEVINSGSFTDLDENTLNAIEKTCIDKHIRQLHFECHWLHRDAIKPLKKRFANRNIVVKIKSGIETFDDVFRENYLKKGIDAKLPAQLAEYFDEICLLFGLPGQTEDSMRNDIEIGLTWFERVCVNIMQKNTTKIKPSQAVIELFKENLFPAFQDNDRVDILMNNTDFGVGGT